jgi:uncharacterized protein (TIGR03435 family)
MAWKALLFFTLIATTVSGPSQLPDAARRRFDVVSIKSNPVGGDQFGIDSRPGTRFVGTNISLRVLLRQAFRPLQDSQIVGGPNFINSDAFDIDARAEQPLSTDELGQLGPALQSLLAERFQLKTHRESKELPLYVLAIGKGGAKFKSAVPDSPNGGAVSLRAGYLRAAARPMVQLTNFLALQLGRPVIDRTGLKGYYDIELQFAPDQLGAGAPPAMDDPTKLSVFAALQEQLSSLD